MRIYIHIDVCGRKGARVRLYLNSLVLVRIYEIFFLLLFEVMNYHWCGRLALFQSSVATF